MFSNPAPLFPSFNTVQGTTYFKDALKDINCMKVFTIPSSIPKLKKPNIPFNLSPPPQQEITRIIKRMKSSGSAMPVRPDIDNLFQAVSLLKIIHVRFMLDCTEVLRTPYQHNRTKLPLF